MLEGSVAGSTAPQAQKTQPGMETFQTSVSEVGTEGIGDGEVQMSNSRLFPGLSYQLRLIIIAFVFLFSLILAVVAGRFLYKNEVTDSEGNKTGETTRNKTGFFLLYLFSLALCLGSSGLLAGVGYQLTHMFDAQRRLLFFAYLGVTVLTLSTGFIGAPLLTILMTIGQWIIFGFYMISYTGFAESIPFLKPTSSGVDGGAPTGTVV